VEEEGEVGIPEAPLEAELGEGMRGDLARSLAVGKLRRLSEAMDVEAGMLLLVSLRGC
jgi:hypothetical protein